MKVWLYSAALLILAAACNTTETTTNENSEITDVRTSPEPTALEQELRDIWVLVAMGDVVADTSNFPQGNPVLELNPATESVVGSTGCNRLNGKIIVSENGSFVFDQIAATKMYCLGVNEADFLDYLTQTKRYKREGLSLMFYNDSIEIMTFKKVD